MIYSRPKFYVCCDNCGKTIEIKATDERTASETAKRDGWMCKILLPFKGAYHGPKYVNLCPECKNEKK